MFIHKCSKCHKIFSDQFSKGNHEKCVHNIKPVPGCKVSEDGQIITDEQVKQEPQEEEQGMSVKSNVCLTLHDLGITEIQPYSLVFSCNYLLLV